MKKITKLVLFAAAALCFLACAKEQTASNKGYEKAAEPVGNQFGFTAGAPTLFEISPADEKVSLPMQRYTKDAAATAKIAVKDTSGLFFSVNSIDVAFAAGEDKASLDIPVTYDKMPLGRKFLLELKITEESSPYTSDSLAVILMAPEPWKSLGKGYYNDAFTFSSAYCETLAKGKYEEIEIFQNEVAPEQFKIVGALKGYYEFQKGAADPIGGKTEEFVVTIVPKGTIPNPNGEEISVDDCVMWDMFATEPYDDTHDIFMCYPSIFNSRSLDANYQLSHVVAYQENGLPETIVLSPYWYVFGYDGNGGLVNDTGGWGFAAEVTIVFPGVPITDYSVSSEFQGVFSAADGDKAIIDVTLGEDVESALVAIVAGKDPSAALALILAEDESVVEIEESGSVQIVLPELAEYYTYVVATVGGDELQELDYATFAYRDFSVDLDVESTKVNPDGATGEAEISVDFGDDVKYVMVTLIDSKEEEDIAAAAALVDATEDNPFIKVWEPGVLTFNLTKEGDYTVVAIPFAEGKYWDAYSKSFEFVLVDPWELLGVGILTDDIACPIYGIDPIDVPCNVYELTETPGMYKVTDFQLPLVAAVFDASEEDLAPYKNVYWRNSPLVIDATDPDNVFIEFQDYGVCFDSEDGFFDGVTSLYKGEPFSVGTLTDGVIAFPTPKGMLCTIGGEGYYYADINGAFKVVLPSAVPASAPAKVSAARGKKIMHNTSKLFQPVHERTYVVVASKSDKELNPQIVK